MPQQPLHNRRGVPLPPCLKEQLPQTPALARVQGGAGEVALPEGCREQLAEHVDVLVAAKLRDERGRAAAQWC